MLLQVSDRTNAKVDVDHAEMDVDDAAFCHSSQQKPINCIQSRLTQAACALSTLFMIAKISITAG